MGFLSNPQKRSKNINGGEEKGLFGFQSLIRRKQVDSIHSKSSSNGDHQLAKELSIAHLIAIGILHLTF